jgi:hypothetical protein
MDGSAIATELSTCSTEAIPLTRIPDSNIRQFRRLGPAIALVSALLLATGATACGSAVSISTHHNLERSTHVGAGADADLSVSGQQDLDSLYTTITGTAAQRGAGELVAYHLEEDPFTDCMRSHGVNYDPVPEVDMWDGWPAADSGGYNSNWIADLTGGADHLIDVIIGQGAAQRAVATDQAAADAAYAALSDTDRMAWDAAADGCKEGAGFAEAWHPDGYYALLADYREMISNVERPLDDQFLDGYQQCMMAAGIEVSSHSDLVNDLSVSAPTGEDVPVTGDQGDDAWTEWVTTVRTALDADANCRGAAYAPAWAVLGPAIEAFLDTHAQALADEEQGWETISNQAAGYSTN